MTEEQKNVLIKDLCCRLPYGVKMEIPSWDDLNMEYVNKADKLYSVNADGYIRTSTEDQDYYIDEIKPYLFPLSSMTEEQKKEEYEICKGYLIGYESKLIDFYHKNHLDYRGLIPMGLASDCTNLNIY